MSRRVAALAALAAAVAAAASCAVPVASKVPDDATVSISGSFLAEDGSPLADADVTLSKVSFSGPVVARSGADGSYRFTQRGSETKNWLGQPALYNVSVKTPNDGPGITLSFGILQGDIALPEAQLWDGVTMTPNEATQSLDVALTEPVLARGTRPGSPSADVFRGSQQVWEVDAKGGRLTIPGYALENVTDYRFVCYSGTDPASYRSAYRSFKTGGKAKQRVLTIASITDGNGDPITQLTDGDLDNGRRIPPDKEGDQTTAILDLGARQAVSRILLWDSSAFLKVSLTDDPAQRGTSFDAPTATRFAEIDAHGASGRYLKLVSDTGSHLSALDEVRVVGP